MFQWTLGVLPFCQSCFLYQTNTERNLTKDEWCVVKVTEKLKFGIETLKYKIAHDFWRTHANGYRVPWPRDGACPCILGLISLAEITSKNAVVISLPCVIFFGTHVKCFLCLQYIWWDKNSSFAQEDGRHRTTSRICVRWLPDKTRCQGKDVV